MKKISCGVSGTDQIPSTHRLSQLPCDAKLIKALIQAFGEDLVLRPAQDDAVFKHGILAKKRNAVLTTPTNSGKSLIAYLLLFAHAARGHRASMGSDHMDP